MSGSQSLLIGLLIITAACSTSTPPPEEEIEESVPEWDLVDRPSRASLRGLDVGADGSIWASGTEGIVQRSIDSGKTWQVWSIQGAGELDFRDVEAFDANRASVMSSGQGVEAYFTSDGGVTWNLAHRDDDTLKFFDGMDFLDGLGYAFGDPIDGKLQILKSIDSGQTWIELPPMNLPNTIPGEAGYAASGTGIVMQANALLIATGGGKNSRLLSKTSDSEWQAMNVPINSAAGSGIFSMAVSKGGEIIVVGGSYVDSTNSGSNAAISVNGVDWTVPNKRPNGYRSCVTISDNQELVFACGRTGCDFSRDLGNVWHPLTTDGFFACTSLGTKLIGVGRNGKVGVLDFKELMK
ncbi:MAG: hypothetical protein HN542_04650 [Flavobacteriales bacterium]|jgi:photosystem II stability/assembly factor-like uncharacterized protein|nr:hypothetical protein [Flavobacteriales bacterium]NCG30949.1 hypothetical protein [Bacteroidota bacterium]MBT3963873.1 hypothetical protein [Flavobacteriales bacterium]MBT4706219.1 hypothetical protein [Flavobacteriales bacterium]MBT4931404.1 hypothetical protein [Flavobacteriales bacterium]